VDWAAVAKASPTLVLYMARSSAGEIAARLIAAGRAGDEPAAIISNASFSEQSVTVTTLAGLGEAAQSCTTPAIIVIGENVRLREGMDWLGAMGGKLLNPDPLDHSHFSKAG
jgi:uroporphyrin-III C-methyltransferase